MALRLNNIFAFLFFILFASGSIIAQEGKETPVYKEYKNPDQFDNFYKKRKFVGAWQINQLKGGALVVMLKTNQILIDALLAKGDTRTAEKKRMEALAVNLNLYRAFCVNYKFSKLYFVYSDNQDTLLNGARSNIFLDSNLILDPKIVMTEKFYLLSESDNVYNSSIGFVPEDSARKVVERGDPTLTKVPIVIKNKYGHQLKRPFPFYFGSGIRFSGNDPKVYVFINGMPIPYYINGNNVGDASEWYMYEGKPLLLSISKSFTYKWLTKSVQDLNHSLELYLKSESLPDAKKTESVTAFLY